MTTSILVEDYANLESLVKQTRLLIPQCIDSAVSNANNELVKKLIGLMQRIDRHLES